MQFANNTLSLSFNETNTNEEVLNRLKQFYQKHGTIPPPSSGEQRDFFCINSIRNNSFKTQTGSQFATSAPGRIDLSIHEIHSKDQWLNQIFQRPLLQTSSPRRLFVQHWIKSGQRLFQGELQTTDLPSARCMEPNLRTTMEQLGLDVGNQSTKSKIPDVVLSGPTEQTGMAATSTEATRRPSGTHGRAGVKDTKEELKGRPVTKKQQGRIRKPFGADLPQASKSGSGLLRDVSSSEAASRKNSQRLSPRTSETDKSFSRETTERSPSSLDRGSRSSHSFAKRETTPKRIGPAVESSERSKVSLGTSLPRKASSSLTEIRFGSHGKRETGVARPTEPKKQPASRLDRRRMDSNKSDSVRSSRLSSSPLGSSSGSLGIQEGVKVGEKTSLNSGNSSLSKTIEGMRKAADRIRSQAASG